MEAISQRFNNKLNFIRDNRNIELNMANSKAQDTIHQDKRENAHFKGTSARYAS
jgi:hypothetical protein